MIRRTVERLHSRWQRLLHGDFRIGFLQPDVRLVFRLDPAMLTAPANTTDEFATFESFESIPRPLIDRIVSEFGERFIVEAKERFAARARLHTMCCEGAFASFTWSKRGRDIPAWLIPLDSSDAVHFGVVTVPRFRGQGIRHRFLKYAYANDRAAGCAAIYTDCAKANGPAVRSLEKQGWTFVTETRVRSRSTDQGLVK